MARDEMGIRGESINEATGNTINSHKVHGQEEQIGAYIKYYKLPKDAR